jgi:integrase
MPRQNLTDAKILALRPRPKRFDVQDALLPGLVVHVTPRGKKSFMLKRRFPGSSNPTRRRIGEVGTITIAQARDTARQWLAWLERGIDPADELAEQKRLAAQERLQRNASTFAVVAEDYIARRLAKQRRGRVATQAFHSELLPHWGDKPLNEIKRGDVVKLVEAILDRPRRPHVAKQERSGAYARNVLNHIRSFFNWCIARDIYGLANSPCDHIKPKDLIGPAKTRERVLDDVELQTLMRVADDIGYPFGDLVKLLVLTGARKSEVAGARWAEFDLATRTWTIPAVRFKTGTTHEIPLTDNVIELLNGLYRFKHGDFLFSTTFGRAPFNGFSKAKARLDRLMREQLGELQPFTLHDLRRTMRTRLAELRIPEHIAEAAIGHAKRGIVAVYNRARYSDELREAFETWHAALLAIVNPPAANVMLLHEKVGE